jgi:outer membrane lipoprotein-sorting protein
MSPKLMLCTLAFLACPASARAAPAPEVAEVRDCAERNLPKRSARQHLALERSVRGSEARRLEATLLWKKDRAGRSRVRVTVDAPQPERGTSFLLIERDGEDEMFSYLPEYRKVRRITRRAVTGSFFGTDLSYEDFQQLQGLGDDDARIVRLPDEQIDGRPVYVLEGTPKESAGSAYERVRSYIDRESCVLLRAVLSGRNVEREVMVAWADVERVGERWIPKRLTLYDRRKGSETRLAIGKTEWDVALPDRLFTETELAKGH